MPRKTSKDQRGYDVKAVSSVTARRRAGCGRAGQIEEDPAYAHSLSRGKRGTSMAMAPSTFQNPRMAKKYMG